MRRDGDIKYIGNMYLLSYTPTIIKMLVCAAAIGVIFAKMDLFPAVVRGVVGGFCIYAIIIGFLELYVTKENRRFAAVSYKNGSKPVNAETLFSLLKSNDKMFCVLLTDKGAFRVGTDYIRYRPEETKRYYIDIVKENKIERDFFSDFEVFRSRFAELCGDSEQYSAVYWDDFTSIE